MIDIKKEHFSKVKNSNDVWKLIMLGDYKQQILQNHEDVKSLRNENQSLKYERIDLIIDGKKDKEDAKKWKELQDNDMVCITAKEYNKSIVHQTKDRQIVKRLEERIKWLDQWLKDNDKHDAELHENFWKPFWAERIELQKILEG